MAALIAFSFESVDCIFQFWCQLCLLVLDASLCVDVDSLISCYVDCTTVLSDMFVLALVKFIYMVVKHFISVDSLLTLCSAFYAVTLLRCQLPLDYF